MALQTKSYSVGTGSYDSTYVGFVLTLNITENSTSQASNTSNISYELILSNPNNQYPYEVGNATRYVELMLGSHNLSQNVTGSWVFNSSTRQKTLLSGSLDIAHNTDGSLTLGIYAKMPRLRTDGKGPLEMVISDTMVLTGIQRIFTNTIHHVKLRNDGSEVSRETTSFTALYGSTVTIPKSHIQDYPGFSVNETASFFNRYGLPDKPIGDTFVQPEGNVNFDYHYYPNVLTINYYSNYADYGTWKGPPLNVDKDRNVLVVSEDVPYTSQYDLNNVQNPNYLFLSRTGYTPTGYWGTSPNGGKLVHQDTGYSTGQALAEALGTSILNGNVSIDVYPQWTPNTYKVTLDNQGAITAGTKEYWYLYNTVKLIDNQRVFYYADSGLSSPIFGHTIEIPTKTGYTFGGYFTGVDGAGTQYINPEGLCVNDLYLSAAADTTLYAKWIRDVNITFNGNVVDSIVFNGQPVTSLVFNGNVIY